MRQYSVLCAMLGAIGLAGLLSACGSSGSASASASGAGSGAGSGSALASGTITGFGSVYVNGKKFETEGASVSVDGQSLRPCTVSPSDHCGLHEGMTVKVSGSFSGSSHRATTIVQEDTVEGPITAVDVANSRFTVLGQTVLVDETTTFDSGVSLANLVVDDIVEVSGFIKSEGIIAASFIERKAGTGCGVDGCEIKGVVKNHTHATTRFEIGGLTVIYDRDGTLSDTTISDMPAPDGSNWNGLFVEVKGAELAGTTLTATKVELENDGPGINMDELEVEGFVTQAGIPSGNIIEFTIGTTPVRTTVNTEFRGGTVEEIVAGAKMSAEGQFDGTTLIATHVKFHEGVRLEGDIETIGLNIFTIKELPGVTVTVNNLTEFKATGGATAESLSDLVAGSHVRVRGRMTGGTTVIATRIQLRSPDNDLDIQGPVQVVSDPNLTMLGVTIDTTGVQFEGVDDGLTSREAFFSGVTVGALVKVHGRIVNGTVQWREAELEY